MGERVTCEDGAVKVEQRTGRVTRTRRLVAAVALVVLLGVGLIVARVLPDSTVTDVAGDALYAAAVYAGLAVLAPRMLPPLLAATAAAWCVVVELFQLTGLPIAWSAAFPPAGLVLGSGFDPRDLVVYVAAAGTAWSIDAAVRRRIGIHAPPERLNTA